MKPAEIGVVVIAGASLAGAGYYFGAQRAAPEAAAAAAQLPPGHPPTPAATALTGAPKPPAGQVGPPAGASDVLGAKTRFSHFSTGGANVKAMLQVGGDMWVGTSKGVIRYDLAANTHRFYDHRNGLLANGVFSVDTIGDRIAVGTHGGGLAMYDPAADSWQTYNVPEGLGDAFVYDVVEGRDGDVWIATWTGLNQVTGGALDEPGAWKTHTVASTNGGLPNDWVYGLAEGAKGEIWIATEGGIARYAQGRWDNWAHDDGVGETFEKLGVRVDTTDPSKVSKHHARQKDEQGLKHIAAAFNPNYIVALTVDHQGTPWFGTWGGGMARWTGSGWENTTTLDGLPSNHVFMIHEDPEHRMWVGTSKGLARLDGDTVKAWTKDDGLFANSVFSAVTATDGAFWVGSMGGVSRFTAM